MLSNAAYAALFALVFVVSVEAACDTNKFNECYGLLPAKPNATKIDCVKTENWFIKSVLSPFVFFFLHPLSLSLSLSLSFSLAPPSI
jgi:hypothetical protein